MGLRLQVRASDPLSVLFDGYSTAKRVRAEDKARARLVRRADGTRLNLAQSAADQAIIDGSEINYLIG